VSPSSPRVTIAEGDITRTDRLVIELVDTGDTPQVISVRWPDHPTAMQPRRYADFASAVMRLFALANVELTRLRARRR
jgi:hypothetical protein